MLPGLPFVPAHSRIPTFVPCHNACTRRFHVARAFVARYLPLQVTIER